jgi:hypothetical protein
MAKYGKKAQSSVKRAMHKKRRGRSTVVKEERRSKVKSKPLPSDSPKLAKKEQKSPVRKRSDHRHIVTLPAAREDIG